MNTMSRVLLASALILSTLLASTAAYARHGYYSGGVIVGEPYYPYPPYYGYPYYAYRPAPVVVAPAPVYAAPYPLPPPVANDRYYRDENGLYCREYSRVVRINGHRETAYGHACRMPDGNWQIMD